MKALGLSFSLFVFASLAAAPAQAHFRASFHPSHGFGPTHGWVFLNGFRRPRWHRNGSNENWDASPDSGNDSANAPPQYVPVPVPVPVAVPFGEPHWTPSHPKLILIGAQERRSGPLPEVVYGDPPPEKHAKP